MAKPNMTGVWKALLMASPFEGTDWIMIFRWFRLSEPYWLATLFHRAEQLATLNVLRCRILGEVMIWQQRSSHLACPNHDK